MTNNLKSGVYTVIFNTLITQVYGNSNYKVIQVLFLMIISLMIIAKLSYNLSLMAKLEKSLLK